MKKIISVFLSLLMFMSLGSAVYAAEKSNPGKGKEKKTEKADKVKLPSETVLTIVPADTLEGLTEQLKANHKTKELRKNIHNRIKEVRKQRGDLPYGYCKRAACEIRFVTCH